jgi:hypothetical protein
MGVGPGARMISGLSTVLTLPVKAVDGVESA